MLKINEAEPVQIPSAASIADDWPNQSVPGKHVLSEAFSDTDAFGSIADTSGLQLEGPLFMQLWIGVLWLTRRFVVEISQRVHSRLFLLRKH